MGGRFSQLACGTCEQLPQPLTGVAGGREAGRQASGREGTGLALKLWSRKRTFTGADFSPLQTRARETRGKRKDRHSLPPSPSSNAPPLPALFWGGLLFFPLSLSLKGSFFLPSPTLLQSKGRDRQRGRKRGRRRSSPAVCCHLLSGGRAGAAQRRLPLAVEKSEPPPPPRWDGSSAAFSCQLQQPRVRGEARKWGGRPGRRLLALPRALLLLAHEVVSSPGLALPPPHPGGRAGGERVSKASRSPPGRV